MCRIEHPNVVRLFETFEDDVYFYLVMEMICGGELFDMVSKIKKYSEQDAAKAFGQIVKAIEHLQENKIVHRDLVWNFFLSFCLSFFFIIFPLFFFLQKYVLFGGGRECFF